MLSTLMAILLLCPLTLISVSSVPVGVIRNSSLIIIGANTTTINGTYDECVCKLLTDPTFFSFNCFLGNLTCHFHSIQNQNQPFTLITADSASFYFASLPTFVTTPSTGTCIREITTASTSKDTSSPFLIDRTLFEFRCSDLGELTGARRVSLDIRLDLSRHLSHVQRNTCQ